MQQGEMITIEALNLWDDMGEFLNAYPFFRIINDELKGGFSYSQQCDAVDFLEKFTTEEVDVSYWERLSEAEKDAIRYVLFMFMTRLRQPYPPGNDTFWEVDSNLNAIYRAKAVISYEAQHRSPLLIDSNI
ncbi:hypothetical protein [Aggregatibacter actinomycetemcomitans]|uniref:hypothetical protein n=1 Tax=Aggregatibacter actinomycetemcomitans TaxID=714 RepID=UPI00197BB097|nr:hypothetical protein [Aggregatibacter actinomycetemcomitans]MBN6060438.1 hypothetical protein [Aggregatibacter actinomycetemcomitans]MBN6088990.1 hypothetical protein [Aggregatibacter actinomycetemcomitans]